MVMHRPFNPGNRVRSPSGVLSAISSAEERPPSKGLRGGSIPSWRTQENMVRWRKRLTHLALNQEIAGSSPARITRGPVPSQRVASRAVRGCWPLRAGAHSSRACPHRASGPGQRPFKSPTPVRIRLGEQRLPERDDGRIGQRRTAQAGRLKFAGLRKISRVTLGARRGVGEFGVPAGLITLRSRVQIPPPLRSREVLDCDPSTDRRQGRQRQHPYGRLCKGSACWTALRAATPPFPAGARPGPG